MNLKSQLDLNAQRGSTAKTTGVSTLYLSPGRYQVNGMGIKSTRGTLLKKGEILTHRQVVGKGMVSYYKAGEQIAINEEQASIQELDPSITETWYSASVLGKYGFSDVDPFEGSALTGCQ
jgi:hypothetical protein